jgi:hypothetical protein
MNAPRNPAAFGPRGTFAMIAIGFVSFIALLFWMGTGEAPANNGGAHGQGKGIAGYAALAAMLAADGHQIGFNRVPSHIGGDELVVLTPLPDADVKDMKTLVQSRRNGLGPTILVTPKWMTMLLDKDPRKPRDASGRAWAGVFGAPAAPSGWTTILGAVVPQWKGFLDKVGVVLGTAKAPAAHGWNTGDGLSGPLADDHVVLSGGGSDDLGAPLVPLVRSGDGRILAGYFADGGSYPELDRMAGVSSTRTNADNADNDDTAERKPLVIVFEPDLLNNRGLADRATALMAQRLVMASAGRGVQRIVFDLSLAGLGAPRNLLTLAFSPPFLAATICLILAMAVAIWRGFNRFGPARVGDPALPAGKAVLVAGGAALLLRARRYHLIAGPYVDASRERLIVALGLARRRPTAETDIAIARIQHAVAPGTTPFGEVAARLAAARKAPAIAALAAELHSIEQALGHDGRKGEP